MKKLLTLIKSHIPALAPLGLMLLFTQVTCLGAVGVAWSIYNKMTGKEWGNQAFGSLLSFAFGTIVAVFWQLAQGRAVGVDTNF